MITVSEKVLFMAASPPRAFLQMKLLLLDDHEPHPNVSLIFAGASHLHIEELVQNDQEEGQV